jgi:adenosylhomocysteinase
MAESRRMVREFVEEFKMFDGRKIYLLADGRLLNLAAAEGHPAAVMDMSFANQALSAEWVAKNSGKLENKVYVVPREIDQAIASLKLTAMGIKIDTLTAEQETYMSSWQSGT